MADGVTVTWQGERFEVAKRDGAAAKPDRGPVWQVTRGGAPVTSFPAEAGEAMGAVKEKVIAWLEANADRPASDVGRQ